MPACYLESSELPKPPNSEISLFLWIHKIKKFSTVSFGRSVPNRQIKAEFGDFRTTRKVG
jgi:hypothetical protein